MTPSNIASAINDAHANLARELGAVLDRRAHA